MQSDPYLQIQHQQYAHHPSQGPHAAHYHPEWQAQPEPRHHRHPGHPHGGNTAQSHHPVARYVERGGGPRYQTQAFEQHPHHPANRAHSDPNHYDGMFHSQTRSERRVQNTGGNRNVMDYNLYAPKFENHTDSTGYEDTWTRPQQLRQTKEEHRDVLSGDRNVLSGGRDGGKIPNPRQRRSSPAPRRGERVPMPSRTAPPPAGVMRRHTGGTMNVSHALSERQLGGAGGYETRFPDKDQQIDRFNRTIDSMHLPDDMTRPIATRDVVKRAHDETLKGAGDNAGRVGSTLAFENPASSRVSVDIDYGELMERQFSVESGGGLAGGAGTYEDMFY